MASAHQIIGAVLAISLVGALLILLPQVVRRRKQPLESSYYTPSPYPSWSHIEYSPSDYRPRLARPSGPPPGILHSGMTQPAGIMRPPTRARTPAPPPTYKNPPPYTVTAPPEVYVRS